MHVVVEALGNRGFGGATVLLDFLDAATANTRFSRITALVPPRATRSYALPGSPIVSEIPLRLADQSIGYRAQWMAQGFDRLVSKMGADVAFSLNGMASVKSRPSAVLIQQPMPFYPDAAAMYGYRMQLRFGVIRLLMARACRSSDLVFVQTETMRGKVSERFRLPETNISIHTPAVTRRDGSALSGPVAAVVERTPPNQRLLYVGSDQPHKNLPILARGMRLVRAEMPEVVLFATLPPGHPICADDGIECIGELSPGELLTTYQNATALCQPSLVETVGLPMLEAMDAGTPVIASDRAYAREICRDAGSFFNPTNAASFAQVTLELLLSEDLREEKRLRGFALARERRALEPYREMAQLLADLAD